MTSNRTRDNRVVVVVAGSLALLVAGAALVWRSGDRLPGTAAGNHAVPVATESVEEAPLAAGASALPARRFNAGELHVYRIDSSRRVAVAQGGGGADTAGAPTTEQLRSTLQATLGLAVTGEADGAGVRVRARLADPRYVQTPEAQADPRAALTRPFYFTLLPSGEVTSYYYSRGTSSDVRALLQQIVASLQLVTPASPMAVWKTTEQDASGEFLARYVLDGGSSGRAVRKTKPRYLRARGPGGLVPMANPSRFEVDSRARFQVGDDGWPTGAALEEAFDVTTAMLRVVATTHTEATLAAVEQHPELRGPMPADVESAPSPEDARARRAAADRTMLDGQGYDGLRAALASTNTTDRDAAQARLAALIRLEPETAGKLVSAVAHNEIDANGRRRVIGALASAGSPEAQAALIKLLDGSGAGRGQEVRMEAASALGFVEHPEPAAARALQQATRDEDRGVVQAATLASGALLGKLRAAGQGDGEGLLDQLLAGLEGAATDAERVLYLKALGNSGDLRALPAIRPWLANPIVEVRAAAVSALRFMADPAVDDALALALADPDLEVRAAAVATVPFRPVAGLLPALAAWWKAEPDANLRLAFVNALNPKRRETPAVEELLRTIESTDSAAKVRELARQIVAKAGP